MGSQSVQTSLMPGFCIHLDNTVKKFVKFLIVSKFHKEKITFFNPGEKSCLKADFCIFIYGSVILNRNFFSNLSAVGKKSNSGLFYFDYKFLKSILNLKSSNLPVWSKERFLGTNYLGAVLALNNEQLKQSLDHDLSFYEIASLALQNKVEKVEGINYLLVENKGEAISNQHFQAVNNFLQNTRPCSKVLQKELNKNDIANFECAPQNISVIIPTRGTKNLKTNKSLVVESVESLVKQNLASSNVEVIIVYDHDSPMDFLAELRNCSNKLKLVFIEFKDDFNFSKKCNVGARHSTGNVLIFLNDDTQWLSENGILELAGTAMLEDIGAVGAKLFFSDDSIQHGGTVVIDGNVGHAYFKQKHPRGVHGDLEVNHEVSSVTGACFAQRKNIWSELNGWDEAFANSYNDVEYGFRIRDAGYKVIQNNNVELYHFESLTRDPSYSPEAYQLLKSKWQKFLSNDPFFVDYVATQKNKNRLRRIFKKFLRKLRIVK